jgi:16S rRNA (adenine1518-N6/adenine1519-N6)-dimethyltransferase
MISARTQARVSFRPKKSLGQSFLIDKNVQRKIIDACELNDAQTVLEIGPGRGELTRLILAKAKFAYAVELDSCLCTALKEQFRYCGKVRIICGDILKFNFNRYLSKVPNKVKIIGNIPYYITTPILEYLIAHKVKISSIFLTVQKEFAKRIVGGPGSKNYGAINCFIQYHADPRVIFTIKKECFRPQPKVDSCLLRLDIKEESRLEEKEERRLFRVVRTAFNQRRKTLRNSLKTIIPAPRLTRFFLNTNLSPNIRPENLTLENFIELARI